MLHHPKLHMAYNYRVPHFQPSTNEKQLCSKFHLCSRRPTSVTLEMADLLNCVGWICIAGGELQTRKKYYKSKWENIPKHGNWWIVLLQVILFKRILWFLRGVRSWGAITCGIVIPPETMISKEPTTSGGTRSDFVSIKTCLFLLE